MLLGECIITLWKIAISSIAKRKMVSSMYENNWIIY